MLIPMSFRKPGFALLICVLCAPRASAGDPPNLDAALSHFTARMRAELAAPNHTPSRVSSNGFNFDVPAGWNSARSTAVPQEEPIFACSFDLMQDPPTTQPASRPGEGEDEAAGYKDESGNDPRDFRNKFMPYYRMTELRNGLEAHEWVLFGFYAFTPRFGMTYEIPAKYVDASEAIPSGRRFGFNPPGPMGGPPIPGFGGRVTPGIDAYQTGLGDSIFRFFYRPEATEWETPSTWGPMKGESLGGAWMPLIETTLPTNTDDLLGSDAWVLSPGFVIVQSTPTFGFIAGMFFYDFSTFRDNDEPYVSRFRARIFVLQPFSKPGPGIFDGIYLMPEFQPIYDLREGRFSLWIGPEFGKIIKIGEGSKLDTMTLYAKPGWGWAPDAVGGDREFSMEVGIRLAF